ncbi:hypothetical protein OG948_10825 [Embleya sp. NBC_00888]|uniref:hypothetical protein n=1 Tax=Embleya sp. NBC_00888 TaxID=2975960 RepID=UPI003865A644|nr:hypothetical protein OG948_10825 [Embleya sp. NBC_00888]
MKTKYFGLSPNRWLAYENPAAHARRGELALAIEGANERRNSLDDAFYVQGRFKGTTGQHRYDHLRDAIDNQLESMNAELAEISASTDLGALSNPDRLHNAWMNADLEQARMLLRIVLHSATVLPPAGQGHKRSVYNLLSECCFHWVGEKPQPLHKDLSRLAGTVWYDLDTTASTPLTWAA